MTRHIVEMSATGSWDRARLLFLAAWACPTSALCGGGLPAERIVAAFIATILSGVLIGTLPAPAFRLCRLLTSALVPLAWLWIGYVTLNGMGPSAGGALATLANTTVSEAATALHLVANAKSVSLGLLQAVLLATSYAYDPPGDSGSLRPVFAMSLLLLMVNAWLPRMTTSAPAFLPGRDDLENFPYGSIVDMAGTWLSYGSVALARSGGPPRLAPHEPHVDRKIDSIFVLGESFRFTALTPSSARDDTVRVALAERFGSGLGVALPKVCASADATVISVPMLLSGTPPEGRLQVATAPSGLARLAVAGYETAWISNQEALEFFGDERRDLVWIARGYANAYDDAVLPVVATFLDKTSDKNKALLIHLMDSHAAYEDRYPPEAEPRDLDSEKLEELRYHRANDHTLMVLERIAALIDAAPAPAFAVYVSDHGENLLADRNGLHYHFGARTSAKTAYVPSFVFWNKGFRDAYHPMERLQPLLAAPYLAHRDVYALWMSFSGLPNELTVTGDPKIYGKAHLTDSVGPVSCASLAP